MNAVLLAPHNDDETLFASYLILRYRPKVIVCLWSTRMHMDSYPGGPLSVNSRAREFETEAALRALDSLGIGGNFEQWDISDANPDWPRIGLKVDAAIKEADVVIAPAVEENGNEQHTKIGRTAEMLAGHRPLIQYLTYTSLGRSNAGHEVPFEPDWPARKLAALACYRSQIQHPATAPHFLDGGLREWTTEPLP